MIEHECLKKKTDQTASQRLTRNERNQAKAENIKF